MAHCENVLSTTCRFSANGVCGCHPDDVDYRCIRYRTAGERVFVGTVLYIVRLKLASSSNMSISKTKLTFEVLSETLALQKGLIFFNIQGFPPFVAPHLTVRHLPGRYVTVAGIIAGLSAVVLGAIGFVPWLLMRSGWSMERIPAAMYHRDPNTFGAVRCDLPLVAPTSMCWENITFSEGIQAIGIWYRALTSPFFRKG